MPDESTLLERLFDFLKQWRWPEFTWPFLLTSLLIMVGAYIYWSRKDATAIGFRSALRYIFPKSVYAHKSAITDYKFALVDPIVRSIFFAPAMEIPVATLIFGAVQSGLLWALGEPPYELNLHENYPILFTVLFTILYAMLRELGFYWQHRLMHTVPFLWEFHKVHHSATTLTPITQMRNHPLDLLSMPYIYGVILGTAGALIDYAFTSQISQAKILGINLLVFGSYAAGYHLRHTHIWLSYGWVLNHVFMSPAQHQVHHSTNPIHFDKNYGAFFSIWDWAFGTLYNPKTREELSFGLGDPEEEEYSSLWRLYSLPFLKNHKAGRTVLVAFLVAVLAIFAVSSWWAFLKL